MVRPDQLRLRPIADAAASWGASPQWRYAWVAITPGDQVVGIGELRTRAATRSGELSYAVHHQHWGRGVGKAIGGLLRDFGFECLALHRVEATCDPRNVASARILHALGMTLEGTLRANLLVRDGWRDSHIFSILEGEWHELGAPSVADRVLLPDTRRPGSRLCSLDHRE